MMRVRGAAFKKAGRRGKGLEPLSSEPRLSTRAARPETLSLNTVMSTTVALPEIDEEIRAGNEVEDETERLYHVILLDDDDHTYEYVIEMLMAIFAFSERKGYEHTVDVDTNGHTRLLTCGLSEAEAKRDKIHAYGADPRLDRSLGSMAALIEPAA